MARLISQSFAFSSIALALSAAAACSSDKEQGTGSSADTGTVSTDGVGPTTSDTSTSSSSVTNTNGTSNGTTTSGSDTNTTTSGTGGMGTTATTTTGATSTGGGTSSSSGGATSTDGTDSSTSTTGSAGGGNNPIAGTDGYDCSAPEGDIPALTLTQIATLNGPVDLVHPPNDPRLFVITLDGDVRIIKDGQLVDTPFLSLGNRIILGGAGGDERGLLGIAFHPDYAQNGLFYLHYSAGQGVAGASTGDTVIEEYQVSSDPDLADPDSGRIVFTHAQANTNHNGGAINFGSDGLLYIGLGDGGGSGDMSGNAQNTSRLLGKILRINPMESGGQPYTTPEDNLVQTMAGAAPEIWDYGLRNPFRSSFDACTGDFYIGDVGQNTWEEVDIEKAGEGHKNYGWNTMEALHCYPPNTQTCDDSDMTEPMVEIDRQSAQSITGGSVYRGSSIPALRGIYFYADYQSNNVWYLRYDRDAGTIDTPRSATQDLNASRIVAIRNGSDGELYFVSLGPISAMSLGEGGVYRLEAAQ